MKLVHFLQLLLFGVAVFGRAIEDQIADTTVVKGDADQLPYRFRYNVASQDSGDYKSQTESRDGDGVVTGMYQVLQPDGCVRVVHYTADAMGFHPTVTYEGDCRQPVGSINTAAAVSLDPSLKDVSAPINPSSAFLSRPVLSAVPGLINPLTTDVRDSTQEVFISRPSQQTVSQDSTEKLSQVLVAAATSLSQKMSGDMDSSGAEPSRPVKTTSNENSAVKTQSQSEEIIVASKLPTEGLSILTKRPVGDTQTVGKIQQQPAVLVVPQSVAPTVLLNGNVESSNSVPLSILSLFDSFEPTKKTANKYEEVDPLEAQPSEFSERILKDESHSSSIVVESVAEEESDPVIEETVDSKTEDEIIIEPVVQVQFDEPVVVASAPEDILSVATVKNEETIESKSIPEETKVDLDETVHEEDYSLKSTDDGAIQSKNIEPVDPQTEESDSEKERSFSTLTQSALNNVKNFTAPLTQLISSSVQNLTNPVTTLLNTFNKNKLTTTTMPSTATNVTQVAPVTVEPTRAFASSEIEAVEEAQEISSEKLIVTDHNNEEKAFTAIDGAVSADIASASQHNSKQTILVSEDTPTEEAERILAAEEENFKKPVVQNLESISIEVNDPAATVVVVEPVAHEIAHQDSAEPMVIDVSDSIPADTTVSVADPVPADVAEGTLHESSKVAGLEETHIEQVEADVRETSSSNGPVENENVTDEEIDVIRENKEFYQVNADRIVPSETYVSIAEPVIYSHQIATGPFYVTQPIGNPIRQATARAIDSVVATPYGLRVQNFVPTYATLGNAPPSYVYNQHRRQGYQTHPIQMHHYKPSSSGRFVGAAAAAAPVRSIKKQSEAYGMRNTNIQQAPPTNSHYTVRPKAAKQPTWSPFYSTYVR